MKTNFNIIIMAIAIAFAAVSCGKGASVDAALSQIEKSMDKVEKNKTSMTEADWQALGEELEQPLKVLNDALENNQVGAMKKLKITAVMMRYMAVASEAALHTATEEWKAAMEDADSNYVANEKMQELFDSDEMKQALQELQKATEELQKPGK